MHDFISMPVKLAFLTFRFPELKKNGFMYQSNLKTSAYFHNCLGALDGKHIKLRQPINSGSSIINTFIVLSLWVWWTQTTNSCMST